MVASTHNLNQKKRTPAGKRKARFLAVFLSVLLAAALLPGCGSQQEEEQQAELTVHTETEDTFSTTVMIGVSEYSTANLTQDGKQLIENAILYLLGVNMPTGIDTIETHQSSIINHKFIHNGMLFIQAGDLLFDVTGRRISR